MPSKTSRHHFAVTASLEMVAQGAILLLKLRRRQAAGPALAAAT